MTDHDMILNIARAVDAVRDGIATDPNASWVPLEAVLPQSECAGFMFMGTCEAQIVPATRSFIGQHDADDEHPEWERRTIWKDKHGIARQYLNLADNLLPYYSVGSTVDWLNTYAHVPGGERALDRAIEIAFDGLDKLGADRTTAYNNDYIAARNARLAAAGYSVIG